MGRLMKRICEGGTDSVLTTPQCEDADADADDDDHSVFVYEIMQIYKQERVWSTKYIGYTTSVANICFKSV